MATATKPMPRLADFAPAGGILTPMEQIAGRDLRMVTCEPETTQYGRGYRMTLIDVKTEDAYEVLSSAVVVVKQLDAWRENGDPFENVIVKFERPGKAWLIV